MSSTLKVEESLTDLQKWITSGSMFTCLLPYSFTLPRICSCINFSQSGHEVVCKMCLIIVVRWPTFKFFVFCYWKQKFYRTRIENQLVYLNPFLFFHYKCRSLANDLIIHRLRNPVIAPFLSKVNDLHIEFECRK